MRNYQLMRSILKGVAHANKPLDFYDFHSCGQDEDIQEELQRLKKEGLIEHNMSWSYGTFNGGEVTAITEQGRDFFRNIENEKVWRLILKTLEEAELDLSYPLLNEVCEEVVKRYVMSKITTEF